MDGTLGRTSMNFWDWHGFMSNTYSNIDPFKALSDDECDAMFTELYSVYESEPS